MECSMFLFISLFLFFPELHNKVHHDVFFAELEAIKSLNLHPYISRCWWTLKNAKPCKQRERQHTIVLKTMSTMTSPIQIIFQTKQEQWSNLCIQPWPNFALCRTSIGVYVHTSSICLFFPGERIVRLLSNHTLWTTIFKPQTVHLSAF